MKRSTIFYPLIVFLALIYSGCETIPNPKTAKIHKPIEVSLHTQVKPIQFGKFIWRVRRGEKIGGIFNQSHCTYSEDYYWRSSGKIDVTDEEYKQIFREELTTAGYKVAGNPDALFDDPSLSEADLMIAGIVKELRVNFCFPWKDNEASGWVYIKVNWQIYSKLRREVVYALSTEGSAELDTPKDDGANTLLYNSFGVAVNNLLADKGFINLLIGKVKKHSPAIKFTKLSLKAKPRFISPIADHINEVRAGVVTVRAGLAHGSGFFIDREYLLTNQHVVNETKTVKLILPTKREILGNVVRVDKIRDVALIRAEEGSTFSLPINNSEPNIGDGVYAIGSPLDENLDTTVSKGIISSYRTIDELRYIQSDVNVLPGNSGGPLLDSNGNVVGLTVSIKGYKGSPTGLNFFIPIKDALKAMNIEVTKIPSD